MLDFLQVVAVRSFSGIDNHSVYLEFIAFDNAFMTEDVYGIIPGADSVAINRIRFI